MNPNTPLWAYEFMIILLSMITVFGVSVFGGLLYCFLYKFCTRSEDYPENPLLKLLYKFLGKSHAIRCLHSGEWYDFRRKSWGSYDAYSSDQRCSLLAAKMIRSKISKRPNTKLVYKEDQYCCCDAALFGSWMLGVYQLPVLFIVALYSIFDVTPTNYMLGALASVTLVVGSLLSVRLYFDHKRMVKELAKYKKGL